MLDPTVADARVGVSPRVLRAALPLILLATGAAWLLLRGIDHRFISFSDGVYLYASSIGASDGWHELYRDVALSLPPGAILGAGLLWKLSPHIETVRAALLALGIVTSLLTYRLGRQVFGLGAAGAALGALAALAGPVHAQFVGLEGEAVLTPLALALTLALMSERYRVSCLLLGLGFFFKLTWAPFFVAGLVALVLRRGAWKGLTLGLFALLIGLAPYAAGVLAFDWPVRDLVTQLLLAQSHSGLQPDLLLGIAAALVLLWWPFLVLARAGFRDVDRSGCLIAGAAGACALFTVKQGTFFNVLDPLEPFLALAAVAGGRALWQQRRPLLRSLVVVCAAAAVIHAASITNTGLAHALPFPLGAALVNTDNEDEVDRIASAVAAHSDRGDPVLVNPFFALVADRREPRSAADWFILESLERYCGSCSEWGRTKSLARAGRIPVVGIDSNVVRFDPDFARDVGAGRLRPALRVDAPPIKTTIFIGGR